MNLFVHEGISLRQLIRQPITPPRSECRILVEKMLNDSERGCDGLIAHGASIVSLMRGFGGSLGHVVGYHVERGAKGGANMAELNMMAKHMPWCVATLGSPSHDAQHHGEAYACAC